MTERKRDNVKIGLQAGILLTMLVTSVGFAFHAGRVRQMVDANTVAIRSVAALMNEHLTLEGHPVVGERVDRLVRDVAEVKDGVKQNSRALNRIESKLGGT